ncbi:MAG: hypothetical protein IJX28_00710 [Clostridia bacterium]|nr:hypothetical protein [Clostridia bacterium]
MEASLFYTLASHRMKTEMTRLTEFTQALDRDPAKKKQEIAAYKCAKYREAGIANIYVMFYNSYRLRRSNEETCYLISYAYEVFSKNSKAMELYSTASPARRPDVGLYLGILEFARALMEEKEKKLPLANDWERVELSTYLEGHRFAVDALRDAWKESGGENYDCD